jgi:hypothetical protein
MPLQTCGLHYCAKKDHVASAKRGPFFSQGHVFNGSAKTQNPNKREGLKGSLSWRSPPASRSRKLCEHAEEPTVFMAGIFRNLFNQFTMKDPLVMSAAVCYGLNTVGFAITAATHTHKLIDITGACASDPNLLLECVSYTLSDHESSSAAAII